MVPRLPASTVSCCEPSMTAVLLSAASVTVVEVLRVTVSSTEPSTGCQSRRSVSGTSGPSVAEADSVGVDAVSVGDDCGTVDCSVGVGGADDSSAVHPVRASTPSSAAVSQVRTFTLRCCGTGGRGWPGSCGRRCATAPA